MPEINLVYEPQEKQKLLHETAARQIFYGGAAGGGKSHCLRWDLISWCCKAPGVQCYLFRRTYPELEDNHIKFIKSEIPPALGEYSESRKCMEFRNGSKIYFCYCERDSDVRKYLGAEMHVVALDEASQMTETQISFIKTRNRLGGFSPPENLKHALPRFLMGSNPGGPAHSYLKRTFIDAAPPMTPFYDRAMRNPGDPDDQGWISVFIPAKIRDNAYIDAGYEASFSGLPPELARAYRDGDWDAVVGQALHTLSRDRHLLRSFQPPRHWTRFMSIDWGSARPFSVGWYCVSEGALLKGEGHYPDRYLPAGALIRYAEWYGCGDRSNEGLRLSAQEVGRGILQRERERKEVMDYRVGDSQMWAQTDGPSVIENFVTYDERLAMKQSKKDRKQGYHEFLARLSGNPNLLVDGKDEDHPMFFATINCTKFWETVPTLTLDELDPDKGPDTKQEDHCFAAGTMVATSAGPRPIETIKTGDGVLTSWGWRPCIALDETRVTGVWNLELTDGYSCLVTPDHKFYMSDGKKISVDELYHRKDLWLQLFTMDGAFISADDTGGTPRKITTGSGFSTVTSGARNAVRSLMDIISITSTAIRTITTSRTWSVFLPQIISEDTQPSRTALNTLSGTWKRACAQRHLNGINQRLEELGILPKGRGMDDCRRDFDAYARSVGKSFLQSSGRRGAVAENATQRRSVIGIKAITRMKRNRPVYCLNVPGPHNFALANGVLVKNCYDECVYAMRSRPFLVTERDRYEAENYDFIQQAMGKVADPYATA